MEFMACVQHELVVKNKMTVMMHCGNTLLIIQIIVLKQY